MSTGNLIFVGAFAIYLGVSLHSFFNALITDLINPVVAGISNNGIATLEKQTVSIGSVKVKYGDIISHLLQLGLACTLVYLALPYTKSFAAKY
jgi:large-conductance mechanosensitive channel